MRKPGGLVTTRLQHNPSSDPLTLGLHHGDYVIGDGLHKAKAFLVAASPTTIPVYVPLTIG
jgi:hypothetical protein